MAGSTASIQPSGRAISITGGSRIVVGVSAIIPITWDSDVNKILTELLSVDDSNKTMPLAKLCRKRTEGNPSRRMLQEERFLEFNVGPFRWTFNEDWEEVISGFECGSNGDVKNWKSPIAFPFAGSVILLSMSRIFFWIGDKQTKVEDSKNQLDIYLEQAAKENILETEGDSTRFRWVHNKVQEAAMMLAKIAYQMIISSFWCFATTLYFSSLICFNSASYQSWREDTQGDSKSQLGRGEESCRMFCLQVCCKVREKWYGFVTRRCIHRELWLDTGIVFVGSRGRGLHW